jgi:CRP-like cAMP-binding protein
MEGTRESSWRHNLVLGKLDALGIREILARSESVALARQQVLYETGTDTDALYFPIDCLLSAALTLRDGQTVQVGMFGAEGMAGLPELLTGGLSSWDVAVLVPGTAVRMSAQALREAMATNRQLCEVVLGHAGSVIAHMARAIACNRLHTTEQRCARWLLESSDRVRSDLLPITHEQLALMLGVRRPGLSLCVGRLQALGLVRQHRGGLAIVDHDGLAALACECHRALRAE